ncbi:hypothetical protein MPSEU_000673800 [Mayamaea pseudoterrestris]|nr:hypothetical protein MPSEU_000673800 [Mayamaea pseudoterrestris]
MSPKDQAAAATSMVNVPLGSSDASNHPDASGGYFLKWSHLTKTVEVKDMSSGGIMGRSSIAGKAVDVVKKVNDSSNTTSKTILHSVSGYAAPGQVIALMGPSGSGKTSLMNVLSGRSPFQSGQLSINDVPLVSKRDLKKILHHQVAYVKQNDVFFGHLTVKDQLTYTALLRLPNSTSTANKHKEVDSIISQLRLNKVTDSPIKMVSGGERKRVNIATELLTNPKIVLLDEPTSGLDSSSAVRLIHMLQRIAREQQKTIITSIHQPSSEVFMSCFDHLLMLSEGHVVYFGTPKASLGYLQSEVGLPCPPGYNAADHWMDLLVNDTPFEFGDDAATANAQGDYDVIIPGPDTVAARRKGSLRRAILQEAWKEHDVTSADETEHGNASEKSNGDNAGLDADNIEKYPTSWWQQYTILTHRALKNSRSAIFTPLNLIKSFALGLVAGLLWYQLDYTEANVYNMTSFVFFGCTFWVFDSMFMALMAFPAERDVILKERASGSYRLSAYFMAKTTADAPTRILLPLLYLFVSYWMVGIDKTFVVFIGTVGCTLLSVMAGEAIGLLIGAAFYDMQQALTVMTVFALFLMLVGGFFVDNPPIFIAWGKYISPFKYAFDASVQIIFHRPLPCDGSGGLAGICPSGSEGTFVDGAAVSEAVGVQGSIGFNVGLLVVMALVPRYFAYQCLRRKKEGERE